MRPRILLPNAIALGISAVLFVAGLGASAFAADHRTRAEAEESLRHLDGHVQTLKQQVTRLREATAARFGDERLAVPPDEERMKGDFSRITFRPTKRGEPVAPEDLKSALPQPEKVVEESAVRFGDGIRGARPAPIRKIDDITLKRGAIEQQPATPTKGGKAEVNWKVEPGEKSPPQIPSGIVGLNPQPEPPSAHEAAKNTVNNIRATLRSMGDEIDALNASGMKSLPLKRDISAIRDALEKYAAADDAKDAETALKDLSEALESFEGRLHAMQPLRR